MVQGNTWGVTVGHSGLIWSWVVSWSKVIPEVLPWTIVVSSGHVWCHGLR